MKQIKPYKVENVFLLGVFSCETASSMTEMRISSSGFPGSAHQGPLIGGNASSPDVPI